MAEDKLKVPETRLEAIAALPKVLVKKAVKSVPKK